jgi:threonine dehydratase
MPVSVIAPTLAQIEAAAQRLAPYIEHTPVFHWTGPQSRALFGADADVWLKLELFQVTGSFKPRAALNVALSLSPDLQRRGLATFSSGNNAAAVAYAAQIVGTTAKVVMPRTANPARIANCRRYGAEVVLADDARDALGRVTEICEKEGRSFIHPYEGPHTTCGNATLGLEICQQVPEPDAVVVAIGGGGLCSGVGVALKQLRPQCEILAVEPEGADSMFRSFRSGQPERLDQVQTIADSLAPPQVLPYSFDLCRRTVDELVLISDEQMRTAMAWLYRELKLVVEPGGAAALAGALYPFRQRLRGKRIVLIVCGSNIDTLSLHEHIAGVALQ